MLRKIKIINLYIKANIEANFEAGYDRSTGLDHNPKKLVYDRSKKLGHDRSLLLRS